ncbi:MAG TPA: PAS domain-containing sensor histidine kinase, partial [Acidobacteriaceae bacterium]|nr:PAS domain-containing sensor histidine kinase [Acidobacteriaceae bacterium]
MGTSESRRKMVVLVLGTILFVLLCAFTAMNAFKNFLNPVTTGETIVFIGLSFVAFLLFVVVLLLLVRNVLKVYADQRSHFMGTRLRTRMLWGAVLVSLIPIVFMFLFSYGLMNRAVDRWFSQNPDAMRNDSNTLALELAQYTSANARAEAESIVASLPRGESDGDRPALGRGGRREGAPTSTAERQAEQSAIVHVLQQHETTLQGGFASVYREGHSVTGFHTPPPTAGMPQIKAWLPQTAPADEDTEPSAKQQSPSQSETAQGHKPGDMDAVILAAAQRTDLPIFSVGDVDYALGTAAVKQGGTVVVGLPMPYGMAGTMAHFQAAVDNYWVAYRQRRQVRLLYMLLLMMLTSLALFASTWLALHLSKQVTKPVEAL